MVDSGNSVAECTSMVKQAILTPLRHRAFLGSYRNNANGSNRKQKTSFAARRQGAGSRLRIGPWDLGPQSVLFAPGLPPPAGFSGATPRTGLDVLQFHVERQEFPCGPLSGRPRPTAGIAAAAGRV